MEAVFLHHSLLEAHVHFQQPRLLLGLLEEVVREMCDRLVLALKLVTKPLRLLFELLRRVVVFLKLGLQVELLVLHFEH